MINAIIEIGTNSLKFLVIRLDSEVKVIIDETSITRLGEGYLQSRLISESAFQRNLIGVKRCLSEAKKLGCDNISIYGTMIFRKAKNGTEIAQRIEEQTGFSCKILSEAQEAEYSYLAAVKTLDLSSAQNTLVIDSGGGSTELIFGSGETIKYTKSLDVGAVTLTDKFNLVNEVESAIIEQCNKYLATLLDEIDYQTEVDSVIGIGGTITTISAVLQGLEPYQADKVQGSIITLEGITELQISLVAKKLAEKENIIGLSTKRADIILSGVLIVKATLERYEATKMMVCDQGLRYGLALKNWRRK